MSLGPPASGNRGPQIQDPSLETTRGSVLPITSLHPPTPPRSRFGTCARTPLSQVPPSWDPDEVVSGEPLGPRQEEQT